jgi:SAM-dependent methyltransferase
VRYDDYLEHNPWLPVRAGMRFLDVGCGFPPFTTIDTAQRFPAVEIEGIDPAFGRYLVYDEQGIYACIADDGALRFIGAENATPERMQQMWGDRDTAGARFAALTARLQPLLPPGDGFAEASDGSCRIVRAPIEQYASANLTLREAAIGATDVTPADVIRCMAVMIYFDRPFRDRARAWAGRTLREGGIFLHGGNSAPYGTHRYGVWQREGDRLIPREFAISADSLRPLLGVPWYTFQDGEEEATLRAELLGALWSQDHAFRDDFDRAVDAAAVPLGFARRPDGHLGGRQVTLGPAEYRTALVTLDETLMAGGWVERAAEVVQRATGKRAWRNSIGHLAVDPLEWGWGPVAL